MVLKVKTDMGVKQHINKDEHYLETDEDVDYHFNWKKSFQGKVNKEISRGSFAAVFRARTADNMQCAIKKPHPHILSFEESLESYETEIKIHSTLKHPSIVAFYGVCHIENHLPPLIIMERMWTSLYSILEQRLLTDFPFSLKLNVLLDVANGLSYLHSQNIIHRDLTLSNILLNTELKAKISDFGGAQKLDATECNHETCSIPGNFLYMPPEAFASNPVCSPKLDVFCLGCNILCIISEIIPCQEDRFLKVSVAEKYLKKMPNKHPLLRELAANCLNHEPENRPNIEWILALLNMISSGSISDIEHAHKAQRQRKSGVKKTDINIADVAIRKWLKELKEQNSFKTFRYYEILISNIHVVNFFKHNVLESGQQMWLHNLASKFDYALTKVYSTHLVTLSLSFYFLSRFLKSSFIHPNDSTIQLSNAFSSSTATITNTRVTCFVAFSQSSIKKADENLAAFSRKYVQIITVNAITKRKSSIAYTVPAEFTVLLLNSNNNDKLSSHNYVPQERQASTVNKALLGEIRYHHLQISSIKSLHMEAVQPQGKLFTNKQLSLENSASYDKLVYSHQWLSFSDSEHLNKPSSVAKESLSLSSHKIHECTNEVVVALFANSSVVRSKTELATQVCSKVSANLQCSKTDTYSSHVHTALVSQAYKPCSYQHILYIYHAELICFYQTMTRFANVLLCIMGSYSSYFSANGVRKVFWSAQYAYCTLSDQANSVHKNNSMRPLAFTYACKIHVQHKLEAYRISEPMSVNDHSSSQLGLSTSLDNGFYFSLLDMDSQSYIGSDNFFEVRDNYTGTEVATSISLCANAYGDNVKVEELYAAMPRQPGVNASPFYTDLPLLAQQKTPFSQANHNMGNVTKYHNHMHTVSCKGVNWHESLNVCLTRQRKVVLNHNEQAELIFHTTSKHANHQLCITICNDQAIVNVLSIRIQDSLINFQRKGNAILSINASFLYAISPYMVERFQEVAVLCLNMLNLANCVFPCQHMGVVLRQCIRSVSLTDSVYTISYQCSKKSIQFFGNGRKKAVKIYKNSYNTSFLVSLVFDTKEGNDHENLLKSIKVNVEDVPVLQIKDTISQQKCLATYPAKEAPDKMKLAKELDEWLYLQNFAWICIVHNAYRVFTLKLLLLESKWVHVHELKPSTVSSKVCFSGSPVASHYHCQEILSIESMQALAKHNNFYYDIESYGQGCGNASMEMRLHHCKSYNYRSLLLQHMQVCSQQLSLQSIGHSCRTQTLAVTHVIKCEDQRICSVYSYQIVMEKSQARFQVMQYKFSHQEFNACNLHTNEGFSDVRSSQISLQKMNCSWVIAGGMVLETLHQRDVCLFYNVELHINNYVKSAALRSSVDLLLTHDQLQEFVLAESSTPMYDELCLLKSAIGKKQQSQATLNLVSTGTKEHFHHQGKQSLNTMLTTFKQLETFPSSAAKKLACHLMPSVSSYVAYHNLQNATDQCTKGLRETLLVPGDGTMIGKMLHSFPQAICGTCGTSVSYQCNYCCPLIAKTTCNKNCASGQSKIIHPKYNVPVVLTQENQDKAHHNSNKHSDSKFACDDQRIDKNFTTQEHICGGSDRQKRDGNKSHHDNGSHDKMCDLLLDVLRFLLILLLLRCIWLHLPSGLLSQLTTKYHIHIFDSQLPNMSNKSIYKVGRKCPYNISRLHFKPLFMTADATTTQGFLQSNLCFDKDFQLSSVHGKPSPLCSITVFYKLQLLNSIKYISCQLQIWKLQARNLGIECFHCNTTNVALILCEERLHTVTLKTPRIQRLISLLQQLCMAFTVLNPDILSRKQELYFNYTRSDLQINKVECMCLILDREGIIICLYDEIIVFDHDLCYTAHDLCETMDEFLRQTYYRTVTFCTLSQPSMLQCSDDETLEYTAFSYISTKRPRCDIFIHGYESVTQTKHLYIVHTICNNENRDKHENHCNSVRSQNYAKTNIIQLGYNQNFSFYDKENRSYHSNKNTQCGYKEKNFDLLYFFPLLQLLLMLLSVDILELLWLSFGHRYHISNYYFRRHVCYESTSYQIPSEHISGSGNEDFISHCFQENTVVGSQNSLIHSARTILTLTTENRIDAFRPINHIASGCTINYYPNSGSEAEDNLSNSWQLVIGRITLYDASRIQIPPNEQHHEITYGNNLNVIMNSEVNENFDVAILPEQPDLGNNYCNNDNILILVSLLIL